VQLQGKKKRVFRLKRVTGSERRKRNLKLVAKECTYSQKKKGDEKLAHIFHVRNAHSKQGRERGPKKTTKNRENLLADEEEIEERDTSTVKIPGRGKNEAWQYGVRPKKKVGDFRYGI